jgi:hypothetical protein
LPRGSQRQIETLTQDVDALRAQLGDLAERVDFAERMLAQQRERNSLKA